MSSSTTTSPMREQRAGPGPRSEPGSASADKPPRADALIANYFPDARTAAGSGPEIGPGLGVSRQAARQRFTDIVPSLVLPAEVSLRPRLQTCLDRATDLAQAVGAPKVGAE